MTKIVNAYARGLYDLAGEEGLTKTVLEQQELTLEKCEEIYPSHFSSCSYFGNTL